VRLTPPHALSPEEAGPQLTPCQQLHALGSQAAQAARGAAQAHHHAPIPAAHSHAVRILQPPSRRAAREV